MWLAPRDMLQTFKMGLLLKALSVKVESTGETTRIDDEEQDGWVQNADVSHGPQRPRQASGRGEACVWS